MVNGVSGKDRRYLDANVALNDGWGKASSAPSFPVIMLQILNDGFRIWLFDRCAKGLNHLLTSASQTAPVGNGEFMMA
jgi:hypothetical protein